MDVRNPLRSLAPVVDADVLLALQGTHEPLTGSRVAKVAGRSETQVRDVLWRLVDQGLVHAQQVGRSKIYALNRQHVLAPVIDAAVGSAAAVEARIVGVVESWPVPAAAAAVFGSFARRDGDERSDVDLLLVRPNDIDEQDEPWSDQRYELAVSVEGWCGNHAQIVEVSVAELEAAIEAGEPLVASLRRDARWLVGEARFTGRQREAAT